MRYVAAVLLVLSSVPTFAAEPRRKSLPDAKFLAAVDKAIASAQEKAVPTPKLLKLAKVLIKKGRLIRANEVAALIARKGTESDQATAKKINTAVARFKSIVGSWNFGKNDRTLWVFTPDGRLLGAGSHPLGSWKVVGPGVYDVRCTSVGLRIEVTGLTGMGTITENNAPGQIGKRLPGRRVK